jgi:hypothetical protein
MPKVFDWNGYRFHFFANEGDPREPVHIPVSSAGATAKSGRFPQSNSLTIVDTTPARQSTCRK